MNGMNRWRGLLGLVLAGLLASPLPALAKKSQANGGSTEEVVVLPAEDEGGGKPEGVGGGPPEDKVDHSRGPNENSGTKKGTLFGDQWVVVRDLTALRDGTPVGFSWEWPEAAFDVNGDFNPPPGVYPVQYLPGECAQPISFTEVQPLDQQFVYTDYVDAYGEVRDVYLIPLDPECKIPDAYADTWGAQLVEIELGRLNIGRSPQSVLDASYAEAINTINEALAADLDPAGRLRLMLPDNLVPKTIDAPLENLAMYQVLMREGCLADTGAAGMTAGAQEMLVNAGLGYLTCGGQSGPADGDDLQRAAAFLGGAADKSGSVGIDMLTSINTTLGLNDIKTNPDGTVTVLDYYDFGDFTYSRSATFSLIAAALLQPDPNAVDNFFIDYNVEIYSSVFLGDWPGDRVTSEDYQESPLVNFVRAADDTLSVIEYIHSYAVPELVPAVP